MTVFVETNFVLELALRQEQSARCREILRLAADGNIRLWIPAYSLMEPYEKLIRDARRREALANDLKRELTQLGRTEELQEGITTFEELAALLVRRRQEELEHFRHVKKHILQVGQCISLTKTVLLKSLQLQTSFDLRPQDASILASVLSILENGEQDPDIEEMNCFVSRDADFVDPDIEQLLNEYTCQVKYRFDDGLAFIQSQLT